MSKSSFLTKQDMPLIQKCSSSAEVADTTGPEQAPLQLSRLFPDMMRRHAVHETPVQPLT